MIDRWLQTRSTGPSAGMCSRPIRLRRQYRCANGCSHGSHQPVDDGVHAPGAGAFMQSAGIQASVLLAFPYTAAARGVTRTAGAARRRARR